MRARLKILIIFVLAFLLFFSLGIYTLLHTSTIISEPIYVMSGYYYLAYGETFNTGHPLLTNIIAAAPLLFLEIDTPDPTEIEHPYEFARNDWLYYGDNDLDTILFWSRIPFLFLSFFFAYYVFRWVRELYGLLSATFALMLYIFNPDVLWLSTVVMTDLSVAGFMFVSCYYLWKYLKTEKNLPFFLWGVFFGLALASKSTALFVIPIYFALYFLHKGFSIKIFIRDFFFLGCVALLIFSLVNIRDIHPIYDSSNPFYAQSSEFRTDERLYELTEEFTDNTYLQKTFAFVLKDVPVPGASSLAAYAAQFRHSVSGHSQYFMGEYSSHGVWYYYFFEYLVKTPLPFLLILLFSIFFFMKVKAKEWKDELSLLLPIFIFFFITSFLMKLNLGLRHMLFVHFFLFIFAAKVFQFKKFIQRIFPYLFSLLLLLYILFSVLFAPSYIAYFNGIISPEEAPLYVIDDSLDLGQDLVNLQFYLKKNNITQIKLRYAGFEHPEYRNITYEKLGCEPTTGILAVSVNSLYGGRFWYEDIQEIDMECYAWLRTYEPLARIGYSIYVYNITEEKLSLIEKEDQ